MHINLSNPHPCEVGILIVYILHTRGCRHRLVKYFAQEHHIESGGNISHPGSCQPVSLMMLWHLRECGTPKPHHLFSIPDHILNVYGQK